VRWIGVSNYNVGQMKRLEKIAPITSDQPPYSLLRRNVEIDVLPYCEQRNIGTIIYSPMLSGLLTGAMTKERAENLPADDWRTHSPEFREPKLSKNLELVDRIRAG
jgi:aryl-alcohol dehydrogenase-like predicted oxidoreductase